MGNNVLDTGFSCIELKLLSNKVENVATVLVLPDLSFLQCFIVAANSAVSCVVI